MGILLKMFPITVIKFNVFNGNAALSSSGHATWRRTRTGGPGRLPVPWHGRPLLTLPWYRPRPLPASSLPITDERTASFQLPLVNSVRDTAFLKNVEVLQCIA